MHLLVKVNTITHCCPQVKPHTCTGINIECYSWSLACIFCLSAFIFSSPSCFSSSFPGIESHSDSGQAYTDRLCPPSLPYRICFATADWAEDAKWSSKLPDRLRGTWHSPTHVCRAESMHIDLYFLHTARKKRLFLAYVFLSAACSDPDRHKGGHGGSQAPVGGLFSHTNWANWQDW